MAGHADYYILLASHVGSVLKISDKGEDFYPFTSSYSLVESNFPLRYSIDGTKVLISGSFSSSINTLLQALSDSEIGSPVTGETEIRTEMATSRWDVDIS